ncbi:hypothetical protein OSB04_010939 [Centaurea solstitialis]|uniref:RmlD-like substrate binding domain-containing protein n=1 Tax=Centaurea solstitialis TaxID=347529 RepID=A0AA38WL26_9ASTR|nr:hypothetical protein OSB04_010939 [Centaurea solstitialis]
MVCETDPSTVAMSVNVPSSLIKWLSSCTTSNMLLIHRSTDQEIRKLTLERREKLKINENALLPVYEGTKSFYKEDDETLPVNVYGKSKVAAEEYIAANWSNYAILRSSIIFGPQTISPVSKSLPVQVEFRLGYDPTSGWDVSDLFGEAPAVVSDDATAVGGEEPAIGRMVEEAATGSRRRMPFNGSSFNHHNPFLFLSPIPSSPNSSSIFPQFQQHNLQFAQKIHLGEVASLDLGQTTHELLSLDLNNNLGNVGVNEPGVGIRARVLPINEKYALFVSDDRKRMGCLMPLKSVMYKDQMSAS